jgi:hypothetical protein
MRGQKGSGREGRAETPGVQQQRQRVREDDRGRRAERRPFGRHRGSIFARAIRRSGRCAAPKGAKHRFDCDDSGSESSGASSRRQRNRRAKTDIAAQNRNAHLQDVRISNPRVVDARARAQTRLQAYWRPVDCSRTTSFGTRDGDSPSSSAGGPHVVHSSSSGSGPGGGCLLLMLISHGR